MNPPTLDDLVALMARLRGPDGCPWDREQTLESLKTFLLEETYEVLETLGPAQAMEHREELGDLLFQIVFQAQLRAENGEFTLADVIAGIHAKLVRRHPHVFAEAKAGTAGEVLVQWEKLKAAEKRGTARPSLLDHVPAALPALLRALRLTEKAARVGFDWSADANLIEKLHEELREFHEAAGAQDVDGMREEIGDLLFVLANLARRRGLDPEEALRRANLKFERRFRHIEESLSRAGKAIEDAPLEEMERLWEEAKRLRP